MYEKKILKKHLSVSLRKSLRVGSSKFRRLSNAKTLKTRYGTKPESYRRSPLVSIYRQLKVLILLLDHLVIAPVSRTAETDAWLLASMVQRTRNKFQVYLFCLRQELFGELVGVQSIKPGEMKYGGRANSLCRFSSSTVISLSLSLCATILSILSWLFQRISSVLALRFVPCDSIPSHKLNRIYYILIHCFPFLCSA